MTKIGLLIGINYFGTNAELRGCINDVTNINNYLTSVLSYDNENIYKLTDNNGINTNSETIPTKKNIIDNLNKLLIELKLKILLNYFYFILVMVQISVTQMEMKEIQWMKF